MAKPKRTAVTTTPVSTKKSKKDGGMPQLRASLLADVKEAVEGSKGSTVKLLNFSSELVAGHYQSVIPTGSIGIDRASGIGGFPDNRLVEIFGQDQAGKTTLTDSVIASVQRLGGVAYCYDSEAKKDLNYSKKQGVDADALQMVEVPVKSIEAAIYAVKKTAHTVIDKGYSGKMPLVWVWDSVGASATLKELERDEEKGKEPSLAARALKGMLRESIDAVSKAKMLLLIVNHQYEKIGFTGFGPKRTTYGGSGIRYHATMRIEMIRIGQMKAPNGVQMGIECKARFEKNGTSPPRTEKCGIHWGHGFSRSWELFTCLKAAGYIKVGGAWYAFSHADRKDPFKWQGGFVGLDQLLSLPENADVSKEMEAIARALPAAATIEED